MNNKGNILLPIISAVAILAIVAAGYFFWQSQKNTGQPLGPYTPTASKSAFTTVDTTANWKTYKNTQLGFEFKYPNDYSLGETTNVNPVYVQSPLSPARTKGYELQNGELKIEIYNAPKKAIDSPEQCYKDYSGGEVLGEGSIKVGGIATTIYNWRGHGDGQSLCVISGNNRFMISKYPLQTTRQDEFDQILSTFKFTDQNNDQKTINLKVFFNNKRLADDPNFLECGKVFSVTRSVPYTLAVATTAMNQWLKGPSIEEKNAGYSGGTNNKVKLKSVKIVDGVATVDLDFGKDPDGGDGIRNFIAGTCGTESFVSQVRATLLQFSTVKEVQIATNGSVEEFNTWASSP